MHIAEILGSKSKQQNRKIFSLRRWHWWMSKCKSYFFKILAVLLFWFWSQNLNKMHLFGLSFIQKKQGKEKAVVIMYWKSYTENLMFLLSSNQSGHVHDMTACPSQTQELSSVLIPGLTIRLLTSAFVRHTGFARVLHVLLLSSLFYYFTDLAPHWIFSNLVRLSKCLMVSCYISVRLSFEVE